MGINLAEANKVISGAIAKAEEIGAKMNADYGTNFATDFT